MRAGETVNVGVIKIPNPPVPDELWIQGEFGTISGADWPDLNIESPNGEKFGYNEKFLNNHGDTKDTTNKSSDWATYTGWGSEIEKMIFKNPINGEWKIEIRNLGGTETSTFKISSNYPLHVEYIESEEMDNKKR